MCFSYVLFTQCSLFIMLCEKPWYYQVSVTSCNVKDSYFQFLFGFVLLGNDPFHYFGTVFGSWLISLFLMQSLGTDLFQWCDRNTTCHGIKVWSYCCFVCLIAVKELPATYLHHIWGSLLLIYISGFFYYFFFTNKGAYPYRQILVIKWLGYVHINKQNSRTDFWKYCMHCFQSVLGVNLLPWSVINSSHTPPSSQWVLPLLPLEVQ